MPSEASPYSINNLPHPFVECITIPQRSKCVISLHLIRMKAGMQSNACKQSPMTIKRAYLSR